MPGGQRASSANSHFRAAVMHVMTMSTLILRLEHSFPPMAIEGMSGSRQIDVRHSLKRCYQRDFASRVSMMMAVEGLARLRASQLR